MADKYSVLKEYFGHSAFRAGQEQVVDAILSGSDVLCVMPTGAGKSACYQVPAMLFPGVTLVVSPLIALMKDQVTALAQSGIPAAFLNSSLSFSEYHHVLSEMSRGAYKLVYVAPERLLVPDFLQICCRLPISLIAVDEAHCISQWGQDFRPGYLKIADFIEALPKRPVVGAFTATATAEVKEDIKQCLWLRDPFCITTGFDRPNLRFWIQRPRSKAAALLELMQTYRHMSGIIYCATRKTVEEVCKFLCFRGYDATMYHAGLSDDVRRQNQEDFVYDRKTVMVATNAFGMGIDKSNVSYVIHYNMPKNLESYYQEAGRAGRDGESAECILLYSPADVHTNRFLIERSEPNPDLTPEQHGLLKERDYDRLRQMTFYATTNTCLRAFILKYFGEKASEYCGNCLNCLTQLVTVDVTEDVQKILSCIKRTGQRFGKKMIIDVLRGSQNEKVVQAGLEQQSTYGLLREKSEQYVRRVIDFLESAGYIETVGQVYPTLSVTEKASGVLFGGETLTMKMPKEKETARREKKTGQPAEGGGLMEKLKLLRKKLADERSVPAYVVFTDAALADMCERTPRTMVEFMQVSGVGHKKAEQYGELFLDLIGRYVTRVKNKVEEEEEAFSQVPPTLPIPEEEPTPAPLPFHITPEQLSRYEFSNQPLTVEEITEHVCTLTQNQNMQPFPPQNVLFWLTELGFLQEETGVYTPTRAGKQIGLTVSADADDPTRPTVLCDRFAQMFLIKSWPDIMRETL